MSATQLFQLARLYGIQTAYRGIKGDRREAAPHSLLAALRARGVPVKNASDIAAALRARILSGWQRSCEPVYVSWDGEPADIDIRLPTRRPDGKAQWRLQVEDGPLLRWSFRPQDLPLISGACIEGADYEVRRLSLPRGLPYGYHRMRLDFPGGSAEALVITAPGQAHMLPAGERLWGVFLPLYALHSGRNRGAGDLTDLDALREWVGGLGGDMVGTLPLLPTFLDEPFEPSPYSPVSRLFWHEFYLDLDQVAEVRHRPEIRARLETPGYGREIDAPATAPLVDYRREMAFKRGVLESCARSFFAGEGQRQDALQRWAADYPGAWDYARFRAAVEQHGAPWSAWPARMRDGVLREGDYDPETAHYHLYVQWLVESQFGNVSARARETGQRLYLDLPLGVHESGYDVWRERAAFVPGADTGAPPDPFNRDGQNWRFAPPHPENIRAQGYRYYIACLRHHLQQAGVLRIDHVAGLRRLYWIPKGLPAGEGVYVRYREQEFFAILALESHRHQALIVGEDLGTVPDSFRRLMVRRGVYGMYVVPFELAEKEQPVLKAVPPDSLACLNTHDMVPFAGFWGAERTGDTGVGAALPAYLHGRGRLKTGTAETAAVLEGLLAELAAGPAAMVQVNLEDLWQETSPQNIPGTKDEYPNWRRKARYSMEEFTKKTDVAGVLRRVDHLRKKPT